MKKDLKNFYKETIVPSLINDFGYKNIEQVPKIVAVSINRGFGEAAKKIQKSLIFV
jgi:large subunit ribosomal protein L5